MTSFCAAEISEWILDRLALRATIVLHLAHWWDNVTVQSYLARR